MSRELSCRARLNNSPWRVGSKNPPSKIEGVNHRVQTLIGHSMCKERHARCIRSDDAKVLDPCGLLTGRVSPLAAAERSKDQCHLRWGRAGYAALAAKAAASRQPLRSLCCGAVRVNTCYHVWPGCLWRYFHLRHTDKRVLRRCGEWDSLSSPCGSSPIGFALAIFR
jgi:hypothetical protein